MSTTCAPAINDLMPRWIRGCFLKVRIPLTLALSRREREQYRPIRERNWALGFADRLAMILPLPWGEGWGEGNWGSAHETLLSLHHCNRVVARRHSEQ
jgi:hypothetical protein